MYAFSLSLSFSFLAFSVQLGLFAVARSHATFMYSPVRPFVCLLLAEGFIPYFSFINDIFVVSCRDKLKTRWIRSLKVQLLLSKGSAFSL